MRKPRLLRVDNPNIDWIKISRTERLEREVVRLGRLVNKLQNRIKRHKKISRYLRMKRKENRQSQS